MANQKLFLVDVETTGLNSREHDIIEIAYMTVKIGPEGLQNQSVMRVRQFHPRPETKVDPKAFAINGYYRGHPDWDHALTHGSPEALEFWKSLVADSEGSVIAGHRVTFDRDFIEYTLLREEMQPRWHPYRTFDTGPLATLITAAHGEPTASLENAYKVLGGRPGVVAHRAMIDVLMSLELLAYGFHAVKNAPSLVQVSEPKRQ